MSDQYWKGLSGQFVAPVFDAESVFYNPETTISAANISQVLDLGPGLMKANLIIGVASSATGAAAAITVQVSDDAAFTAPVSLVTIPIQDEFTGLIAWPVKNNIGNDKPKPYMRLSVATGGAISIGAYLTKN